MIQYTFINIVAFKLDATDKFWEQESHTEERQDIFHISTFQY